VHKETRKSLASIGRHHNLEVLKDERGLPGSPTIVINLLQLRRMFIIDAQEILDTRKEVFDHLRMDTTLCQNASDPVSIGISANILHLNVRLVSFPRATPSQATPVWWMQISFLLFPTMSKISLEGWPSREVR
jgi:hypothetical protein